MFGKRRRAASNPVGALCANMSCLCAMLTPAMQPQRVPPSVSSSASLAATKAFVRDRESNSNLSNAAAAAALRTHATSPTPVGDTITKRMVRRGSTSSNGSSAMQRPGLQRQNSSGSMTERSFRNPSPGRGSPADANAPPVPALPQNYHQSSGGHRRASSLEPTYRGGSPGPRGGGRGVSLDRGAASATPLRGQYMGSSLANVAEDDLDAGQRASVNFSRPMSPASAARHNASPQSGKGWFGGPVINQEAVQRMASTSRPQTSSGVPVTDLHNAQQTVYNAATRTVSTHQVARGVEGSRLNSGSMRVKPSGTAVESKSFLHQPARQQTRGGPVDPNSPNAVFDPSTRTFIHKQDAMTRHRELHEEPTEPAQRYVERHVNDHAPQPVPIQVQMPRTPSPAQQNRQQQQFAATGTHKREDSLPRLDTSARIRHPEDPPTGFPQERYESTPFVERQHSEDFAGADIQPAKGATSDQHQESTVQSGHADTFGSPKLAGNQDSSYPKLAAPVIQTTSNTIAGQGHGSLQPAHDRGQSLSPQRNAHFAPVAVELAGTKHQPPPRSVSPAKSALKSSPSVSRRSSPPPAANGRLHSRGAQSETSDTTSEGGHKRKKDVRVSFEEKPILVNPSPSAGTETSTTLAGLGASRWSPTREKDNEFEDFMKPRPALPSFGSVRDKERRARQEDEIPEKVTETVSSTPMSASVGSIGEPLHASNDHAIAGIVAHDFAQKQSRSNDPLPPEVTSVEGSGYVSDSSDDMEGSPGIRKHGAVDDSSQILPTPEPKSLSTTPKEAVSAPAPVKEQVIEVPDIALLPATPSPYEKPEPVFQPMSLPGGWAADEAPVTGSRDPAANTGVATNTTQTTSASITAPTQAPTSLRELIERDEDSSDDNSSIYSDAYEDLTDAEGGFGSINAIVESPVVSSSGLMFSRHADNSAANPASGLSKEVPTAAQETSTSNQGWATTQQHWSELNESRKTTDQPRAGVTSDSTTAPIAITPPRQEKSRSSKELVAPPSPPHRSDAPSPAQQSAKPLKSALKKTTVAAPAAPRASEPKMKSTMRGAAPDQSRGSPPQMRQSMRGSSQKDSSASESHMRRTMRGGADTSASAPARGQPALRSSMRNTDAASPSPMGLTASRYSMPPVEQKPPRAALQKRHIPASTMAPRPQSMPVAPVKPVAPKQNYDSDSDASASSFQRSRARRNKGQSTMRSSMRSGPTPSMRNSAPVPAPIRSISPPGSPSPAIRKSMRPSSPTPEAPKSSKFSIRSLSPMGRFRSSKPTESFQASPTQPKKTTGLTKQARQKPVASERAKPAKPAFKSRFADSSDEDEDERPSRFQSRFADSDSDDEPIGYKLPPGLAPVRGIPRKAGDEDEDSTDLEEEAEARPKTSPAAKEVGFSTTTNGTSQAQNAASTNGRQGSALSSGSLRDSKHAPARPGLPSFDSGGKVKTKRGFFGLGKKKTAPKPVLAEATEMPTDTIDKPSEIPMPPQQQARTAGLPLTPIDEDKDIGTPIQGSPETKRSPKLQRRSTPEWPLPRNNIPIPPIPDDDRPMSSDGITPRRPRFNKRQSSQASNITTATAPIVSASGHTVAYGRGGKKKKFQGLRRVFGLND